MGDSKPVHTLVLDTGAIIKNEPAVSTLLAKTESLVTVPAIISEIRDAATRARVETTLKPFLTLRVPTPASTKFVTDFARKTGDLTVLSKPDIQIIALTYELECERNGGDWRLRRVPGQKRVNGAPPKIDETVQAQGAVANEPDTEKQDEVVLAAVLTADAEENSHLGNSRLQGLLDVSEDVYHSVAMQSNENTDTDTDFGSQAVSQLSEAFANSQITPGSHTEEAKSATKVDSAQHSATSDVDSDSEGWITPSNLKQKQESDKSAAVKDVVEPKVMQAAVVTSDYAMQNVILQMNLNLLSPTLSRIQHLKTYVLRCHACFSVSKDLTKQFCPRCGQPTLTRVSCSTNANGEFQLHLKKNMQWNTRGDRYSIPKPVHGSANGRIKGAGKNNWGHGLILTEDQKEYQDASRREQRHKEKNLMDEDYLPSILTGDRNNAGGRTRVGAGRNVNSRKR